MAEYRNIAGFPGYRVGDDGSVWTCKRKIRAGTEHGFIWLTDGPWTRLKGRPDKDGYLKVILSRDFARKTLSVHRLVLEAFVCPRPDGMEVCHFPDQNPANNRLSNLRWDTRKGNAADSIKHGTQVRGEHVGISKLCANDVTSIRIAYAGGGVRQLDLATEYGVSKSLIGCIVRREVWSHVP